MAPAAAVLLLIAAAGTAASAADLLVEVRDARGGLVDDAVVYAIPEGRAPASAPRRAVMDQKNRMFVPHVMAVQTGTLVTFPNSDNVRHQVYSFSPAKRFQLPLYAGTPATPVVFDKAGVVAIGCNIHDQMSAYIVVVDTPYFARTTNGSAALSGLPEGTYEVRVWHEGVRSEPPPTVVRLGAQPVSLSFRVGDK